MIKFLIHNSKRLLLLGGSFCFFHCADPHAPGPQTNPVEAPSPPLSQPNSEASEELFFPEFTPKTSGKFPLLPPNGTNRPFIRVLIADGERSFRIESNSPLQIFTGSPLRSDSQLQLEATGWLDVEPCGKQICLKSSQGRKKMDQNIWLRPKAGFPFKYNENPFKGLLWVGNFNGKLDGVNYLSLEDYVKGILPYEIGTLGEWGIHALEAQAIAARTYSLRNLKPLDERHFDLYNDTRDQVYRGMESQYPLSDQAVENTRSLVLTHRNELAHTYYHSTSGGHTADISQVWNSKPISYLSGTPDLNQGVSWSKESKYHRWSYTFSRSLLIKTINKNLKTAKVKPAKKIKELKGMEIASRTSSGRVAELHLKTDRGTLKVRGDRTRWLFKPHNLSILPSSHFNIDSFGSKIKISGRGFGHGIGLCQMGARARSKAGQSFDQILGAYYPGTEIKALPY